jgi:hypothetical protein
MWAVRPARVQEIQRDVEERGFVAVHALADGTTSVAARRAIAVFADAAVQDLRVVPDCGAMVEELQLRLVADHVAGVRRAARHFA